MDRYSFWWEQNESEQGAIVINGDLRERMLIVLKHKWSYVRNRPWRTKGLWDAEDPKFVSLSA
jgi:hypothetical protein